MKIIACKYPKVTAILTGDDAIVTINPILLGSVHPVCQSPFVITDKAYRGISGNYDFLASSYTCRINTFFLITKVVFIHAFYLRSAIGICKQVQ